MTFTWIDGAYSAFLTSWFAISVLAQLRVRAIAPIRKFDWAHLIPNWSFFAPKPATTDYYLCYRDKTSEGEVSQWFALIVHIRKTWQTTFWNPRRKETKAFFDAVRMLLRRNKLDRQSLELTMPYLVVLKCVDGSTHLPATVATQLAIVYRVVTQELTDPKLLIVSEWHKIT
jgi:hypothetical protein